MTMKIHNMEQRSLEWFAMRDLKMTASNAQAIGNCGKGLDSYILQLVAEHFTNGEREQYTNEHIQRGVEHEEFARLAYELETGNTVEEVGFVEHSPYVGCSPDGLVGEDGGIEIKCQNNVKHMQMFIRGHEAIDSKYVWQIQMCILITRRKWWDFISYNMDFAVPLFVHRFYPVEEMQEKLQKGFEKGEAMIKEQVQIIQAKLQNHE